MEDAHVAHAAGEAPAVEVFEQRNSVLAGHAGKLLEGGDGNAVALLPLVVAQQRFQPPHRLLVEQQLFVDPH